jgi:uncharacterized integral membrane protein
MAQAVVIALLVVGLPTAIFIFQNTTRARVHFLFWSASVPLAGGLILAAALGGILTFLVAFVRQRRITRESRSASRSRKLDWRESSRIGPVKVAFFPPGKSAFALYSQCRQPLPWSSRKLGGADSNRQ